MTTLNSTAHRELTAIAGRLDPDPGPAEAWLLGQFFLGMAAWLAWARFWRWP